MASETRTHPWAVMVEAVCRAPMSTMRGMEYFHPPTQTLHVVQWLARGGRYTWHVKQYLSVAGCPRIYHSTVSAHNQVKYKIIGTT